MSKFTELIKLIPKGIANPKAILESWINVARMELGTLPEDQVEEVVRRRIICNQCPYMSLNLTKTQGYKTSRTDDHCTLCSCPIISKTSGMQNVCGADYFNKTHPELPPLEVHWREFTP